VRLRLARSYLAGSILAGALLVCCTGPAAAQTDPSPSPSALRFKADATLVLIPVTVTDKSNRFVLGLQKQDFHLIEDGIDQTITYMSGEDAPLSVGLVFDISGSMDEKLRISRQAAVQFLKTMNPEDEVCLVAFSDHARLVSGFTHDVADVQSKLMSLEPGGLTALLDAVQLTLGEMKKAKNPRKTILVISDGGDNNSRYSSSQIQSLVREADVQLYAMGVYEPLLFPGMAKEEVSGPRLLSQIAEQTGGRAFAATDPSDLPSVATRIGIELRNQYVLAYTPKSGSRDGKYRKVEVKVAEPTGLPSLRLHWRLGYYAPSQ
jgi:VWFA-related protein